MTNVVIKGAWRSGELADIVRELTAATDAAIMEATKGAGEIVSKEVVRELKTTSRIGGKKYRKGWTVQKDKGTYTVYNAKMPGLTHLLENGHEVIAYGKSCGRAKAHPHIKPAEEKAKERYIEEVVKELNRRLDQI